MSIRGFQRAEGAPAPARVQLDDSQRAVLALRDAASAAVLGAPGSGKTTTIVELVADRVLMRGWSSDEVLVLTPSRTGATRLRDAIALRLAVPTNGPLARTVNSLAFEIVSEAARQAGTSQPRLVTGGDQDADINQLLTGQIEEGTGPVWPELLGPEVRRLRAFRSELRELMARATEYDVPPARLRQWGLSQQHPEWVAAADFIDEYFGVIATTRPFQLDSAELVQFAVTALAGDPGERVSRLRLVVVDDLQEATESTLALLRALAARGIAIIAMGDPDVAANAFRGGEPDALGRLSTVLALPQLTTHVLSTAHRQPPALRDFTTRVSARVGTAAAGAQRAAGAGRTAVPDIAPILTVEAPTAGRTWASIARVLREHHLVRDIAWNRMAVVVRSGAQVPAAARALALAEVPSRTAVGGKPLRDDHAARALLLVVDVGVGRTELTPALVVDLLTGPFGGLDRLSLRRLRLALRAEELAAGGTRSSDELLVEALGAPGRFTTIEHRVARAAERMASTLAAVGAATDATIEELLWLVWDASGLSGPWFEQALGSGIIADEANRYLDGIVALFTAAKRFVEREPGAAATNFLANVLDAEVPEDTLSPQPTADTVFVSTPPGVIGLEYDVVVVAGVQDGAWPNLRLRGSLLNPQELVRVVTGVDSSTVNERALVLGDELRMFALAVSRATTQVIVAAVANEDEARSVFFSLVPPEIPAAETVGQAPLSLRGITGRLRRELIASRKSDRERAAAASALARLSEELVPGANPDDWHGLLEPSTTEPLYGPDETVPVSPSQLSNFEDSPLDWFIETMAGSESSTAMAVGTIVHWAMETATDPSVDEVWGRIEGRWGELSFEAPWMGEHQKRATKILAAGVAEYLADFGRANKTLIAAENRFVLDVGQARVRGSIDRVERNPDGSVVIVDLKTGAPVTKQEEIDAHPQLGAYQLAYAEGVLDEFLHEHGAHTSGGAKLLFVKKGVNKKLYREAIQAPLTEEQLEGFRTRIRQAAAGMAASEYLGLLEIDSRGFSAASRKLHRVRAVSSD